MATKKEIVDSIKNAAKKGKELLKKKFEEKTEKTKKERDSGFVFSIAKEVGKQEVEFIIDYTASPEDIAVALGSLVTKVFEGMESDKVPFMQRVECLQKLIKGVKEKVMARGVIGLLQGILDRK